MPEILDTPPPTGATPVISDEAPPPGVTPGAPQISDEPPPGIAPVTGWQAKVQPIKLKSGAETVLRPDGYVWLDETKGYKGKPGWKTPDLWGGWKPGPDQPKNYKETNDPKEMGDAQIATQLLGMTPEQYLQMSTAGTYKPGMMQNLLKMEAPAENATIRGIVAPARSIMLGAKKASQDITSLATKPLSWMGAPAAELWSNAQSRLLQVAQNQSQSRPALEGGFDPLHAVGGFALGRGPNVAQTGPGTAAAVAQTGRTVALEEGAAAAGREAPSLLARAGDIYRAGIPEAYRSAGVVAATTPGSVTERMASGMAAGMAQPLVETGIQTVLAPGIQRLFNFGKGVKDVYFGKDLKPLPGKAGQLEEQFAQYGIDPMAQNLVENPASKIGKFGEHATSSPVFGLGEENIAQQVQATRAVRNFQKQLLVKMKAAGYDNIEALTKAKDAGEKQATALWNLANKAGDDLPKVISVNGNINRWQAQQEVDRAFEAARASDTGALAGQAELAPALDTVEALIKKHGPETVGEANVNKPLLDYLKRVKRDLTARPAPGTSTEPAVGYDPETRTFTDNAAIAEAEAAAPKFNPTYSGLADYRKGVQNKRYAMGTPGSELTGNDATSALKELQTGVEEAMQKTAPLSPGTPALDKAARALHLEKVVPYKKRALINILSSETPDVAANRMMNMTEDQLAEIVPQLGEKGKAAARLLKIQRAAEAATNRANPNTENQLDPIKFAEKMTDPKFMDFLKVTMPKGGEDKWTVDGLVNVMHHLGTAGKVSGPEAAISMSKRFVDVPAAALKFLLTTRPGKQFLLQASDLKAGSPQFSAFLERMDRAMTAELGKAAPALIPEEK